MFIDLLQISKEEAASRLAQPVGPLGTSELFLTAQDFRVFERNAAITVLSACSQTSALSITGCLYMWTQNLGQFSSLQI